MSQKIRLLVSDVDGTLLLGDKSLSQATIDGVAELKRRGVATALISARPPTGIAPLLPQLGLDTPYGAFNGGTIIGSDGSILVESHLDAGVSDRICALVRQGGADLWIYADGQWFVSDVDHPRVARERLSSFLDPRPLAELGFPHDRIDKIVGVSTDFDVVQRLEALAAPALAGDAAVSRSHPTYCDFTSNLAEKSLGMKRIADLLNVSLSDTAAVGDGFNDVAMLRAAELSFAMANAPEEVKRAATRSTASNIDDGVARAIDYMIEGGLV